MEWKILLYARRKEPLDIPDDLSKYPMNDFELDYWRIVNSAPFRRLQDKTQVFPLDKSDFVRTRLTHSVETSALAKQLTTMITANIRKNKGDTPYAMTEEEARQILEALDYPLEPMYDLTATTDQACLVVTDTHWATW